MNTDHLIALFIRDLDKLSNEIESFHHEEDLWIVREGISNSAGTLAIHIVGNLNHFIGAMLGKTGYVRNREAEFSDRNIPKEDILNRIKNTSSMIEKVLPSLTEEHLSSNYPIELFGQPMTTEYFLLHLYGHLNYHLGQVNYHRRLLS